MDYSTNEGKEDLEKKSQGGGKKKKTEEEEAREGSGKKPKGSYRWVWDGEKDYQGTSTGETWEGDPARAVGDKTQRKGGKIRRITAPERMRKLTVWRVSCLNEEGRFSGVDIISAEEKTKKRSQFEEDERGKGLFGKEGGNYYRRGPCFGSRREFDPCQSGR